MECCHVALITKKTSSGIRLLFKKELTEIVLEKTYKLITNYGNERRESLPHCVPPEHGVIFTL